MLQARISPPIVVAFACIAPLLVACAGEDTLEGPQVPSSAGDGGEEAAAASSTAQAPAAASSTAANVPSTDIYLGRLDAQGEAWRVTALRNATAREGYDNQPRFVPGEGGGSFLFTSVREGQSDIYRYALPDGPVTRVTDTPANEYSATPLPGGAGSISVIRELDGVQQLWRYGPDGQDRGQLFDALVAVGYHQWLDAEASWAAFFLVGEDGAANTLVHARAPGREPALIAEDPGRCLAMIPGREALSFTRVGDAGVEIAAYDLATGSSEVITPTVTPAATETQDYAWAPDGSVLMGDGAALWRWREGLGWKRLELEAAPGAALPAAGQSITRIALSEAGPGGDGLWIALVVGGSK